MENFKKELEQLINKHCLENESNTPDYILAKYMLNSMSIYNEAVKCRDNFFGGRASIVDSDKQKAWQLGNWHKRKPDDAGNYLVRLPNANIVLAHYDGKKWMLPFETEVLKVKQWTRIPE